MTAQTTETDDRHGLGHTPSGAPLPSAWARANARINESRLIGWGAAIAVAALALGMRLWHLGRPDSFQFDETYYAKDAWSLLKFGHTQNYKDDADEMILDGTHDGVWKHTPELSVHPDVGKWIIAAGEKLFGMDPFGWRIAAVIVGALMVLLLVRFVRRLTRSTMLGIVAGLLMCFDGLQFVLSRLALLDIFVAFFVLAAVHCVVADRDHLRRRLADSIEHTYRTKRPWGPIFLFRPWLLASGVCWGLAVGTKWQALYVLAAFGLLCVAWSAGARRSFGVRGTWYKALFADGVPAFVHLVVVAAAVYVATWTPWMMNAATYEENLSQTQYRQYTGEGHCDDTSYVADNLDEDAIWPTAKQRDASGLGEVRQSLQSLWAYHQDIFTFHTSFLNCSEHTYASHPAGWLILNRPVGVNADNNIHPPEWTCPPDQKADGTCPKKDEIIRDAGCEASADSSCLRQVVLLGTPVLWWGGCLALLAALVLWIGGRDWRFGVAVTGVASSWLPWLLYADRPLFSFYTIVSLPFLILAITLAIGYLIGSGSSVRRTVGITIAGAFVVLVIVNFAWFWPIYTNELLTREEWRDRIWFDRWI